MPSIAFSGRSLLLDERPTFLLSAEVQNYRLPPDEWRDRLEKLRAMGCNCVGTYVGWNWHCPTVDSSDFSSPERDLGRFLKICADVGLYVVIRPGPYVCNEWDLGGHPGWLLTEDCGDWRTGDPAYVEHCRRWYRQVDAVIEPHQYVHGGPVILYQVENEHGWGDHDLFQALADQAHEDGIVVPLVSNSGGRTFQCGVPEIMDGWDFYTNVGELWRWRGWFDHVYRLLPEDGFMMVLESMAGRHAEWAQPYPTEDAVPPAWAVGIARLSIGLGANLINFFVGAGGLTPIDFGSDHICTDYYPDAAIKPWGALGPKFYETRLLSTFTEALGRQLSTAERWNIGWGTDNPCVECLVRCSPNGLFLFPNNISVQPQRYAVTLPDGRRLPQTGQLEIGPRANQVLVADVAVAGVTLTFATTPLLNVWRDSDGLHIVAYGEPGQDGWLEVETACGRGRVTYTCGDTVTRQSADCRELDVIVYAVSTTVARRTWFVRAGNRTVPLFGNLDLVRPQTADGVVEAEIAAGTPLELLTTWDGDLRIDGETIPLSERADGVRAVAITPPQPPAPAVELGEPEARAGDTAWLTAATAEWHELAGDDLIVDTGSYRYRTAFTVDAAAAETLTTLEFTGLHGIEAEVFLNGKCLGAHPHQRPHHYRALPPGTVTFDVTGKLRAGTNHLAVAATLIGRHNSGERIHCGLLRPVFLYGARAAVELPEWGESELEMARPWTRQELNGLSPAGDAWPADTALRPVDLSRLREHPPQPIGDAGDGYCVRWYRWRGAVPDSLRRRPLLLEWTTPTDQVWGYANGRLLGSRFQGEPQRFDLGTPEADQLELTLGLRFRRFAPGTALMAPPRLVAADGRLDGPWFRTASAPPFAGDWLPLAAVDGAVPWLEYRRHVRLERPAGTPCYVELLGDWRTNAVLHWNGQPIGRYAAVGPQRRFYLPEGLVRSENELRVRLLGYGEAARCGDIAVGTYGQSIPLKIELDSPS